MMPFCERLLVNATTIDTEGNQLKNQAVAIAEGRIAWCGMRADLPVEFLKF